jgi:hypothetical protein
LLGFHPEHKRDKVRNADIMKEVGTGRTVEDMEEDQRKYHVM